jgi:hypothetical protein
LHWQETHFTPPAAHEADAVLDASQLSPQALARRIAIPFPRHRPR